MGYEWLIVFAGKTWCFDDVVQLNSVDDITDEHSFLVLQILKKVDWSNAEERVY